MYHLDVSDCHCPILLYTYLFIPTNAMHLTPVSEGVGVFVLYLYYFHLQVGKFHG